MIKIVFFDVDGTLLDFKSTHMTEKTIYALNELKKKNIKIFIATGRPKPVAPKFEEVQFDGMMSYNGMLCEDDECVIYQNSMDRNDCDRLLENATKMGLPVAVADREVMVLNFEDDAIVNYLNSVSVKLEVSDQYDEIFQHELIEFTVALPEEDEVKLLEGCHHIKSSRWCPYACDIIPKEGGKDIGILKILEHYGYSKEEAMAFGDGMNDKSMLETVGYGIAMGNAVDEVKRVSKYITEPVSKDGVYEALVHFGLIEKYMK